MARAIGAVTVVGLGLIGSSIARAVMARLPDVTVTGHDASAGVRVIDPAAARALHAQATREATAALRGGSAPAGTRALPVPGPRWPWLLGFIGVAGLLWWLERRTRPAT